MSLCEKADIRYRGPFSYRWLRLFALLALTASQLSAVILVLGKVAEAFGMMNGQEIFSGKTVFKVMMDLGAITFPLILIASFSTVIRDSRNAPKLMLGFFLMALLTYLFIVMIAEELVMSLLKTLPDILNEMEGFRENEENALAALIRYFMSGSEMSDLLSEVHLPGPVSELLGSLGEEGLTALLPGNMTAASQLTDETSAVDMAGWLAHYICVELPGVLKESGISLQELISVAVVKSFVHPRLNINIFADFFLCSASYYFICFTPRRLRGGKLLLFRCLCLIPIAWMVVGTALSGMMRAGMLELPLRLIAILPSRKASGLLLFFAMILYLKYHEAEFREQGKGGEEFDSFLSSNRNSFRFSVYMCFVLVVLSFADRLVAFLPQTRYWSAGTSEKMYLAVPFVLLFSYNRKPRFKALDVFVPVYYAAHYLFMLALCIALLYSAPEFISAFFA